MAARQPYTGSSRKLMLAFDVGTTYSGISYSILDPGQVSEIRGVTRFPAQELVGGDSKIPTILYYDKTGVVKAAGAEAVKDGIEEIAQDEGWTKAEWFKMHLRPKTLSSSYITQKIPPLPPNKTVVDVFADFLRYLHRCARSYIRETHASGADLWQSVEDRIDYVLTHPNGWEGPQQSQMRRAAVMASLIPDTEEGHSRISFVTEGEASLHFCIHNGLGTQSLKDGEGVLIVDAGGGTIDISAYTQSKNKSFEEIAAPQCHFHGSIFVTSQARLHLENLLRNSRFFEDVPHITRCFDKTTKLRFRNASEPQYIKFGSARDRDMKLNIRSGQLKLNGPDVASFFEPSVNCIIQAVLDQQKTARKKITTVYLVGGFAASDWLFLKMQETLSTLNLSFSRPDSHVNKAVADGAVSFYLDHSVTSRVSKFAYGVTCSEDYDPRDPEHFKRRTTIYVSASGETLIPGTFSIILPKNTSVSEEKEFSMPYYRETQYLSNMLHADIQCFRGVTSHPKWVDIDSEMYTTLCTVEADTTLLNSSLQPRVLFQNGRRTTYYRVEFSVILCFGLTELKAQLCWKENGIERRSPAKLVYDPDIIYAN